MPERRNLTAPPILMYHSVSNTSLPHAVDTEDFRRQIEWLSKSGYHGLSLENAFGKGAEPRNVVVLTFDDGYADFSLTAAPILSEHGFTATVFVVTSFADAGDTPWQHAALKWQECRDLRRKGFEIGSHTLTHPDLRMLSREDREREVRESKTKIEHELGQEVNSFAYPFGHVDLDIAREVEHAGYRWACAVRLTRELKETTFLFQRIGITRNDDLRRFRLKMSNPYRWLLRSRLAWLPQLVRR